MSAQANDDGKHLGGLEDRLEVACSAAYELEHLGQLLVDLANRQDEGLEFLARCIGLRVVELAGVCMLSAPAEHWETGLEEMVGRVFGHLSEERKRRFPSASEAAGDD